jgi:hypothetical protein
MESQNSPRLKTVRQMKSKVKSIIIFFDTKNFVHKEFVLACLTVISKYYCDVLWRLRENVQTSPRTLATRELAVEPSHTSFFNRDFFYQNNMSVLPEKLHLTQLR